MVQSKLAEAGINLAQIAVVNFLTSRADKRPATAPLPDSPPEVPGCPWCQAFDRLVVAREHLAVARQKQDAEIKGAHIALAMQDVREATAVLEQRRVQDHASGVGPLYSGRARVISARIEAGKLDEDTLVRLTSLIADCNDMAEGGSVTHEGDMPHNSDVILATWDRALNGDAEARETLRNLLESGGGHAQQQPTQ